MRHHRLVAFAIVLLAIVQPRAHAEDCSGYGDTAALQRINQWDIPGDPWGVAVDPQGYVFVTDPINHRICRYSLNGESPYFFGTYGSGNGEFNEPRWLAFDPVRGRLYVGCQEGPARIQAFNRDGGFLFKIGEPPYDEQPGHFAGSIGGLALDSAGNVFVSDEQGDTGSYRSRIQVFNTSGNFVRIFRTVIAPPNNTPGEWQSLVDIEITSDDEVFVLDTGLSDYWQKRVHHLHIDGTPVDIWGVNGDGPGEFNFPSDLSSDDEFIWVACFGRLMKFRRNGEFVIEFNGQEPRQFQSIDHHPDAPTFLFAGSFMGTAPERLEVFAPVIPAYNVLDSHWLDTNYEIVGDDPALLVDCDESNRQVDTVAADGVTPVLLRYEFNAPYSVTWSLTDLNPGSVPGGIGELASIDGGQHGGSVTTTTADVGGRHFAFILYTAPIDFDRAGCPEDLPLEKRSVRVHMEYEPVGGAVPGTFWRDLEVVRPPVIFVHGLWSRASEWSEFQTILNNPNDPNNPHNPDPRWTTMVIDYASGHGQAFSANAPRVHSQILETKKDLLVGSRTAVAQVDLIAHSMGGCLARKIADSADFTP